MAVLQNIRYEQKTAVAVRNKQIKSYAGITMTCWILEELSIIQHCYM